MGRKRRQEESKKAGSNNKETRTRTLFRTTIFLLIAMMAIVFLRSDGGIFMDNALRRFLPIIPSTSDNDESHNPLDRMPHPGIDLPTISEGMYHSSSNPLVSSIVPPSSPIGPNPPVPIPSKMERLPIW